MMGSVANYLTHHSPCPVVVLHKPHGKLVRAATPWWLVQAEETDGEQQQEEVRKGWGSCFRGRGRAGRGGEGVGGGGGGGGGGAFKCGKMSGRLLFLVRAAMPWWLVQAEQNEEEQQEEEVRRNVGLILRGNQGFLL